jgi:FlaA1/EpsC-like NDP-sugar epimerase
MIDRVNRKIRYFAAMCVDATTAAIAFVLTFALQTKSFIDGSIKEFWWLPLAAGVATVFVFGVAGLYRTILRFAGSRFFIKVIACSIISTAVLVAITFGYIRLFSIVLDYPSRTFVTFAVFLSVGAACSRLFVRFYIESKANKNRIRAIIYGAGEGGHQLFSAIRYGGEYTPVAFVDDDLSSQGTSIHGLKVYSPESIEKLIKTKDVSTILLAMPSMSHADRAKVIERIQKFEGVNIKTTPNLSDWISNKAVLSELHNLSIEDLMTRSPVQVNEHLAGHSITGKSILVTGAGGSIGSELCRQILVRKPKALVLYEITESALFYIQQELLKRNTNNEANVDIVAVLGSVVDATRLKSILTRHKVDSVFHAAAYKHVPMIESNQIEGIRNNIIGTKHLAESCAWANVTSLVVISTDKAVRPTNLMGATKRFAELIVQTIAVNTPKMNTCIVRFGNVLGSSGSVVPIFRNQIQNGGPVTVTHPKMKRYFMTIPEASELVLQAGGLAKNTEVFVLDMGEPEYIRDLASRMINAAGLTERSADNPNGDIEITYTDLRPGEKMFEELSINNKLIQTEHEKIRISSEQKAQSDEIELLAELLEKSVSNRSDEEMINIVRRAVPEYTPSREMRSSVVTINTESQSKVTFNRY